MKESIVYWRNTISGDLTLTDPISVGNGAADEPSQGGKSTHRAAVNWDIHYSAQHKKMYWE